MWKKDEMPDEFPNRAPTASFERGPERPAPTAAASAEWATIGRSITLRGDVTGDEDLMIQGRVEGSVNLNEHSVTVGPDGEVSASIVGRIVTIEGRVEGNIDGGEQVILRNSAFVQGDITAPRVVLENGARFRGLVDMGEVDERAKRTGAGAGAGSRKGTDNGRASAEPAAASPTATESRRTTPEPVAASSAATDEETTTPGSAKGSTGAHAAKAAKGVGSTDTPAELRL